MTHVVTFPGLGLEFTLNRSWVMVAGDLPQSWFISFHSPSDSGIFAIVVPSFRMVDSCLPDISIPER